MCWPLHLMKLNSCGMSLLLLLGHIGCMRHALLCLSIIWLCYASIAEWIEVLLGGEEFWTQEHLSRRESQFFPQIWCGLCQITLATSHLLFVTCAIWWIAFHYYRLVIFEFSALNLIFCWCDTVCTIHSSLKSLAVHTPDPSHSHTTSGNLLYIKLFVCMLAYNSGTCNVIG